MLASQPPYYYISILVGKNRSNFFCEFHGYLGLNGSLYTAHNIFLVYICTKHSIDCCWTKEKKLDTFTISDGFGELVNFLIGLMEFLCSITLFIPQTVMEVPGPGDNGRIIHSHKVRKGQPNPSHQTGLSTQHYCSGRALKNRFFRGGGLVPNFWWHLQITVIWLIWQLY